MSSMACYILPEGGSIFPCGDELVENQKSGQGIYWTQWNSRLPDDLNTNSAYTDEHEKDASQCFDTDEQQRSSQWERSSASAGAASSDCSTRPSEEQSEGPALAELQHTKETNDIFLSQFSDDEMRMMDAPFQALDMFPGSMHRLLSYENMLSGVLTDSQNQEENPHHNEMDTMDTCGFPLFSHDLQDDLSNADGSLGTLVNPPSKDKSEVSTMKRSMSVADIESSSNGEVAVLEELEDIMFQLTKKTRVCLRDAFYRLAESSEAQCTAANGGTITSSNEQSFQQSEGIESSASTSDQAERETNAIDRTVAILAFNQPNSAQWE
uniref:Uncharacterized protein n=1 Tax=Avena sativa TaxID=4498 RepID=A0ACD5VMR0_AVESA